MTALLFSISLLCIAVAFILQVIFFGRQAKNKLKTLRNESKIEPNSHAEYILIDVVDFDGCNQKLALTKNDYAVLRRRYDNNKNESIVESAPAWWKKE
jgi:hypothetical protein